MVIRLSREPAIEKARSYHRRLIGIPVDFPNSLRLSIITQASYLLREPIIGICTSLFLLVIAFTGSYFGFKKEYQSFFESISAGKAVAPAPKTDKYTGDWVSLDSVLTTAQEEFKEGTPTMIFFPKDNTSVFSVRMYREGDFERTGSNHIYIHPITGKVVAINLWKDKPAAEKLVRSMYFVHFGTFLGHFSRILWILISLAIPFLYFTGVYLWVIRNRQKHFPFR